MAKKKKKYAEYDATSRFAPGGSAVSEWEEERRNAQTQGHSGVGFDTSERYNSDIDKEVYKPIKKSTYESYVASKLTAAKASNPNSRININASDFKNYNNARTKLYNLDPSVNLMREKEFNTKYKTDVDKKYRLEEMVNKAQMLDPSATPDLVRKSYNDLDAVRDLATQRKSAEDLLKLVKDYRNNYGDSKELKVIEDRAKGITNYINTNAKGGSAVSDVAGEYITAPNIEQAEKAKRRGEILNETNLEKKFGKPGNLGYDGVKNIKATTPAEQDWKEEKQLQLDPLRKYQDNLEEIKDLENDKPMPLGTQNGEGYAKEGEKKQTRIDELKEQNLQILGTYAEDLINKAKLTDKERRRLEGGHSFDLKDNEFAWDVGTNAVNEQVLSKSEMIKELSKRGLNESEAEAVLDYEKLVDKENARQSAINAGKLSRRTQGEVSNLVTDIATTIGQPLISPLEKAMGVSGEYSHAYEQGRQAEKERYYSDDSFSEGVYNFAETLGTIAGASLYGGAAFVPFTTKATEDSYYNALDKGASEDQASEYALTSGLTTALIYGIGLKGVNKIISKAGKGTGFIDGLAKEIVEGKPTSSIGKALVKNVGKSAAKEGLTFAGLTTTTQVADILNQVKSLGEKSDFNRAVEEYKAQGLSDDDAWKQTVLDISKQVGESALSSFVSGAVMGAGGAVIGSVRQAFNGGDNLPENTLLRSEEGTPLRDNQGRVILDDNGQPIRVQQGLNIDKDGNVLGRNISEEVNVTQRENGIPIIDREGNQVTVNGRPIRAERTTLSGVETYNKLRNEYEGARVGLENVQERIEGLWDDYKKQGFSNPEELAEFESVRAKFNKDYNHVINKAKAILGEYQPIGARQERDLLEGRQKLEDFREDLENIDPTDEQVKAEVDELKAEVDTQIDNIDTVVETTTDISEPTEVIEQPTEIEPTNIEPTEIAEQPTETPVEKAENIDLDNLNDRQSEIAEIGAQYDLSEKAIKSMVANDNEQLSPRMYANEFSKMYLVGKQETIGSIDEAVKRNPELRDTINKIGTQAAGVAFSEGDTPVLREVILPDTKPSGKFETDFKPTLEEASLFDVLKNQAKKTSLDIGVVEDLSKYGQDNAQGISFLNNGKVLLDRKVANILGVADHEILAHFGKMLAPESYKELASIIVDTYQKDLGVRGYDDFIQNLKGEAKEQGIYLTESDAQEEAIAYGLETMAMNTDAMEKFIDRLQDSTMTETEKKTILDKLKEFVSHIINILKERLKDARVRTNTEGMLRADIDAEELAEAKLKVYEEIRTNLENMGETQSETKNELKEKSKFSLSEPVEETKDLVAVHNLHEDDLENSLELGGFAMPSVAIVKAENGHDNYGAISVVFYKDTIDPANSDNKVYSGDAWTPTFPETNYKLDENVRERLSDKIAELVGKQAFSELRNTLDYDNMQDIINRQGGDYINAYKREPIMKLAYLRDTGKKFNIPMEDKHYGKKVDLLERVLEYAESKNQDIKDLWNSEYETYENDGIINDLRDIANKYKQDNVVKKLKGKDKDTLQKAAKHEFYTTENFGFAQAENMLHSAYRLSEDLKNGGIPQVIDTYATSDKLDEIVDNDDKKYNEWLEKTFKGIIEKKGIRNNTELFTPSGYRRDWEQLYDSVTLDNIVKAMRRDIPKGAGFLGAGQPTAAATYEFKDIDDIRSRKDQLKILPEEEYNKIHEDLMDRFGELVDRYNLKKDDEFGSRIDAGHVLSENIARSKTLDQLKQNLEEDSQYGYFYSEDFAEDVWDLVEDMQDTPTGYFEAKPQRAVGLDEIAYTIVPNNTSKELLNKLDENNIEYKTYEKGNEEQRKELLNDERVKFSMANEGRSLSDVRTSLKEEVTDRDIDKYRAVRDDIGKALKLTKGSKLDSKGTKQLAMKLRDTFGTKTPISEMVQDLEEIGTLIETKGIHNTDTEDRVKAFVTDILKSEKQVDLEIQDAINSIRKQKIYLTEKDKKQITDYKQFWRDRFNTLNIVSEPKGAMPVDEFFTHLEQYQPEVYNAVVGDQYPDASTLVDLLNWVKTAKDDSYSLLDQYGSEAVEYFTNEVLNEYSNAKVENITNSRAKQRELYKNVGEMVDAIEGLAKTKDQANKEVLDRARKAQSEINLKLDEQRRNLEQQHQKQLEDVEKKLANEKSNSARKIKAIQEKANAKVKNKIERDKRADERKKLVNIANRILTTIKKPTVHKYIPQPLVRPVQELYESLQILLRKDTPARLNVERDNALKKYTGEQLAERLDKIDQREQAYVDKLKAIRDAFKMYVEGKDENGKGITIPYGDADTYFNPLIAMIDSTIDIVGNTPPLKMDLEQLVATKNVLRAIEKVTVERTRPQTFKFDKENGKPYETYEELATDFIKDLNNFDFSKIDAASVPFLNIRNLISLMGGASNLSEQLNEEFFKADRTRERIEQQLFNRINPIISEKKGKTNLKLKSEDVMKHADKDLTKVGLKDASGKEIPINHDTMLDLYLLLDNDDSVTHAAGGGIKIPSYKKLYGRKSREDVYSAKYGARKTANASKLLSDIDKQIREAAESEDFTRLRELSNNKANIIQSQKDELNKVRKNIEKHLTPYDKKLIKGWKEVLKQSTDMLNDYWEEKFGYRPFTIDNYWRIVVDPNFISGSDAVNKQEVITNLSEQGFTIARQKNARNPILSGSFIFEVDDYIRRTAKTIAYAGLQRDLNAIQRYAIHNADGELENWKSAIEDKMPSVAKAFERAQINIFGGKTKDETPIDRLVATGRSGAVTGAIVLKSSVGLAQLPSTLGVLRYVDNKAFANALKPRNKISLTYKGKKYSAQDIIDIYTPIMFARQNSGFSLETADLKRDSNKFFRVRQKADRLTHGWVFNTPTKFDSGAVRYQFRAILDYLRRTRPDLAKTETPELIVSGKSKLYQEVAKIFEKDVDYTQPMFDASHKNTIQSSRNEIVKSFSAFRTQAYQYGNLAFSDALKYNQVKNDKTISVKTKNKYRNRLIKTVALIVGSMTMYAAIKMAHRKTAKHKDEELTPALVAKNLITPFTSIIPGGQQLTELIYNKATGNRIYDFEILGTQVIKEAQNFLDETADFIASPSDNVDKFEQALERLVNTIGVPIKNLHDEIDGIYRNVQDFIDNGEWDYSNEKSDSELLQDFIKGDKTKEDLKELGIEVNDKTKFSNAVKKLYTDGEIDKDTAIKVMKDSGLYDDSKNDNIEGKIEWWNIYNKYHDDYVDSLDDKGNITKKTREIISQIAKEPYSNAFPDSGKTTYKNYKSPYEKLYNKVTKWKKSQ